MGREEIKVTYNLSSAGGYPELCGSARSTIDSQLFVLRARMAEVDPGSLGLEDSGWQADVAEAARGSIGTPPNDGKWTKYIWEGDSITVQEYEGEEMLGEMIVGNDYSAFEALLAFQAAVFDLDDFVYQAGL